MSEIERGAKAWLMVRIKPRTAIVSPRFFPNLAGRSTAHFNKDVIFRF